jgi:hypothetical protein
LAIGFVVVSGALLLWLLAMVRRAWQALPGRSLVPVHSGGAGWDRWRPKESALPVWIIAGVGIWVLNVGIMTYTVTAAAAKARAGLDVAAGLLILPLIILVVSAQLALKAARRRAAGPQT